ncbi:MAG: hypothetical protein KF869_13075 [Phycisphaeraceae bacterium]|nr:hypothetical protein [Phycisphaeraceae bacterium]
MTLRLTCVVGLAMGLFPCLHAAAQPAAPNDRTGGILVSDTTLDAIYLVRDTDGDGVADSTTVFFDASNASGLGAAAGSVFSIFQAADRTVYIADGDTDTVYALRDNNADGDANDPGEARVWFGTGAANHAGLVMLVPNGLSGRAGDLGAIYICNAGVGSAPDDAVYRTIDLNGDGDANDEGEATLWFNAWANVPNSSPFEICFVGDAAYMADLRGGDPDAILRLRDADTSGAVEAGEFGEFLLDGAFGAACDMSSVTDGVDLYVHNLSGTQTVYRLRDVNMSGAIDAAAEVTVVWDESALPPGAVVQTSFALAHGPVSPVRTMAVSSHGTAAQDAIVLLRDLDGNGDFFGAGETTALVTGVAADGVFPENIRAMAFYAPTCRADFDRNGVRDVPDIFAFLTAWFSNDPAAFEFGGEPGVPAIFAFLTEWFAGCE